MRWIEQRRMLGLSGFDERSRSLGAAQFERNRDDLYAERMKFTAQCLPPGQVEPAASIGRPGDEHDLLPT
jgi:hypothetical protein